MSVSGFEFLSLSLKLSTSICVKTHFTSTDFTVFTFSSKYFGVLEMLLLYCPHKWTIKNNNNMYKGGDYKVLQCHINMEILTTRWKELLRKVKVCVSPTHIDDTHAVCVHVCVCVWSSWTANSSPQLMIKTTSKLWLMNAAPSLLSVSRCFALD